MGIMFKKALLQFDRKFLKRYLYRKIKPRQVHLYCTGTPKSGTTSLVTIFKDVLRVRHEPNRDRLRVLYFEIKNNTISEDKLRSIVQKQERQSYLELNSSCFNYIIINELVNLFPNAKFIHPIRSPLAWLNSWINHDINHRSNKNHQKCKNYFDTIFKRKTLPYAPEERILKKMNLPTIKGMLSYWRRHNLKILNTVPSDRLLVIQTKNISDKIESIYKFAGISNIPDDINTHANQVSQKHGILKAIDDRFLTQKINIYSFGQHTDHDCRPSTSPGQAKHLTLH